MKKKWSVKQSKELYHIEGWGDPYFSINKKGHIAVHPKGNPKSSLNLKTMIDQITERGIAAPVLFRFDDILIHRIQQIHSAFEKAIGDFSYKGRYTTVYPIKVNQQRHVVDQMSRYSKKRPFGLEAGSKPELMAVLALSQNPENPIVCNGYKDREFFELAVMAMKMGKSVYPVIEKVSELETLVEVAKKYKITPTFGVRVKLSSAGSGKWQSSGGYRSKFGLTINELMRGLEYLKKHKILDGFQLLHFHLGSQITDIQAIKKALKEAARVYVELKKMNVPVNILDVGGGLGVDYDGSQTRNDNSVNYSLQEYANDVVFQIQEICKQFDLPEPNIITECGRAVTAHHSVLVFNVLGASKYDRQILPKKMKRNWSRPLKELFEIFHALNKKNALEYYHDAVTLFQECLNLFNLGYMSLEERGFAEDFYFGMLKKCKDLWQDDVDPPEEYYHLREKLADTYFCNFSVFQSLPDYWAIDHRFPILPLQRLNEKPTKSAILADITCDSDGKVDSFIDPMEEGEKVLPLHELVENEDYYLGVFLVGAYQETLGDLHNLFGDTNVVHVKMGKTGKPVIESVVKGDTVKEVLGYVQYDVEKLISQVHAQLETAVNKKQISFKESGEFMRYYETALEGYTYLEETLAKEEF
jgi:arginine decarboxylase